MQIYILFKTNYLGTYITSLVPKVPASKLSKFTLVKCFEFVVVW